MTASAGKTLREQAGHAGAGFGALHGILGGF